MDTPANGTKSGNETACGAVTSFACDLGFTLSGSSERECLSDGNWSGNDATCDGMLLECILVQLLVVSGIKYAAPVALVLLVSRAIVYCASRAHLLR